MTKDGGLPTAKATAAFGRSVKKITDSVASQRERFIETARASGADEDEATFKAKLGVIARQKPKEVNTGSLSEKQRDKPSDSANQTSDPGKP